MEDFKFMIDWISASFQEEAFARSYSRLNMHCFSNGCFLDRRPILARMRRIQDLPGVIIHGRYDLATPERAAVELARRWPKAELVTVSNAGAGSIRPRQAPW